MLRCTKLAQVAYRLCAYCLCNTAYVCARSVRGERFGPADQRDLTMLGYLGLCFDQVRDAHGVGVGDGYGEGDGVTSVPRSLNALVPYRVPWGALALHVVHTEPAFDPVPREQYLRVFNAALVALCVVPETQVPVFVFRTNIARNYEYLYSVHCLSVLICSIIAARSAAVC